MIALFALFALAAAQATPASDPAAAAVSAAFATCEAWVLQADTRAGGAEGFAAKAGLADKLTATPTIPDAAMPPPALRASPHYWYIGVPSGGLFVSVSDTVRGCNVIGGAATDLQPGVESALASASFKARWRVADERHEGDMHSTRFASAADPDIWMLVSRAEKAGGRRDRAQIAITVGFGKVS